MIRHSCQYPHYLAILSQGNLRIIINYFHGILPGPAADLNIPDRIGNSRFQKTGLPYPQELTRAPVIKVLFLIPSSVSWRLYIKKA